LKGAEKTAFDDEFDHEADARDELAAEESAVEDEDAFEFESEARPATATPAAETAAPERAPAATPAAEDSVDGIDAILAELDSLAPPEKTREPVGSIETDSLFGDAEPRPDAPAGPPASKTNFLQEARRAAKEAAEKAAAEVQPTTRRALTPKQRAILAAKLRRKRLAEQGLTVETAPPPPPEPALAAPEPPAKPAAKSSLIAGLAEKVRARFARAKPAEGAIPAEPATPAEDADQPNLAQGVKVAVARAKTRPVTIALGAAIALAAGALFLLVKDLLVDAPKPAPTKTPQVPAPVAATQPQLKETAVPAPPALTQPRTLYLNAVAQLRKAANETETKSALGLLEQAASLGHPPAQLQLGELYKLGQGAAQDSTQARAWYERSANGGNVLAMHRLGVMAARGQGGPADQAAAIAWFEKAANFGLVDSQYNLGAIYHPASDGPAAGVQDAAKAYFWYSLASRNGDDQAAALAQGLAAGLSAGQRSEIDASVAAWTAATPDPDANEVAPAQ
jgi:localization factor PodJL